MKKTVFTFVFYCFLFHLINAQAIVWNKELPLRFNINSYCSVQQIGDRILIGAQRNVIELDKKGGVVAATNRFANTNMFGRFLREKTDPNTGERYFLMAYRNLGTNQPIVMEEFRPQTRVAYETVLEEQLQSLAPLSPAFVDINDSTYVVFGKNYIRRIVHRPGQGVVVQWEKPFAQGDLNAAIRLNNGGFITVSQKGNILAINENGDSLWMVTAGFILRDIQKTPQGWVVSGSSAGKAVVAEYSENGTLQWIREYADDATYEQMVVESDGGLTVMGRAPSNEIVLHRLKPDGTSVWRKEYQRGLGCSLVKTTDGGYLIAGAGIVVPRRYMVIKTDSEGNTGAFETAIQPSLRKLENEQMLAQFAPTGSLFFDATGDAKLEMPKDSATSLFFAAGLWLAAVDPTDQTLHVAATTYENDGRSDYRPGMKNAASNDFSHVWSVSRAEIEALRLDWADNGVLDAPVPADIRNWPARNNPDFTANLDFSIPSTDPALLPAPFVDVNNDGMYSILDGDYPRIKGDRMAWWVVTDSTQHTRTNGLPLEVDIAVSAYLYDCFGPLENTLFVDYAITSRNDHPLGDMFAGLWTDPDLGCPFDDYVGCIPSSNAFYVYNQDAVDGHPGSSCDGGAATFGNKVPVASVTMLNVALNKFAYSTNGASNNQNFPDQDVEYYNLMQGAYDSNGQTDTIDFFLTGNPADMNSESLCSISSPGLDPMMLGSHGPFPLASNDTFLLSLAFTYHPDVPHPCPDIYGTVKTDIDQLRQLANSGALAAPANWLPLIKLLPGQSAGVDATVPGATDYLWSNGSTTPSITVNQIGTYTVTITRVTGCTSVETVLVKAASPVIEQKAPFEHCQLSPNPNQGQFTIEMRGLPQEEVTFTLVNSVGQTVRQETAGFSAGSLIRRFDCTPLPVGLYTMRIQAGEQTKWIKVAVQR